MDESGLKNTNSNMAKRGPRTNPIFLTEENPDIKDLIFIPLAGLALPVGSY
jgi:hypothetical protein